MTQILNQLELNQTFFYIFGIFIAFYFIVSRLYLKPFQELIEKRNQKLKEEGAQVTDLLRTVEEKLAEYQKILDQTKTEARINFEKAVADIKLKEEAQIAAVRDTLKADYLAHQQKLNQQKIAIEAELKVQAGSLAEGIALKVLGEK